MNLNRTALTDCLPNEREGFHSAILTTFSFDFYFFEMVLLRRLRSIGVRNVVVMADANMLHTATQHSSGFGSPRTKTYNLVPVQCGGAFHPKLLFLFGEKAGWLAIGSGNLTESGHGKNDEVWGAFYYSKSAAAHENLFAEAWDFIKIAERKYLQGYAKEQIMATADHAPWLEGLSSSGRGNWSEMLDGCKAQLIHSGSEKSVWESLRATLPEEVTRITVCSPFFDREGALLQKLTAEFPKAKFQVVVEPDWGQLPAKIANIHPRQIQFFDWKSLAEVPPDSSNHWLHAKIYVFETPSHGQFCLFGSSNASVAGFGLGGKNQEMNILLQSDSLDFLTVLGLEMKDDLAKDWAVLTKDAGPQIFPPDEVTHFETIIMAAEIEERQLSIYTTKTLQKPATLVLFNADGLELQSTDISWGETGIIRFKYAVKEMPFSCQIVHQETRLPLSNRQVVVYLAELRKSGPNPAQAKFEGLLDRLRDGENAAIADILSLIEFEIPEVPEQAHERGLSIVGTQFSVELSSDEPDVELTEEEFTQIPSDRVYRSHYAHFDPARDLSDFLLQIGSRLFPRLAETDGAQDEELIDAETGERKDGAIFTKAQKEKKDTTDKETAAVKLFLERYRRTLSKATERYLRQVKKNEVPDPLTTRDLSLFLIALRLIVRYGDRRAADAQNSMPILPFKHGTTIDWKPGKIDSVQIACYEVIGKMLLLLNAGIAPGQTTREISRLDNLQEAILYDLIFLLSKALSDKYDADYIPLFYFNTLLHFRKYLHSDEHSLKEEIEKRSAFGSGIAKEAFRQIRSLLAEFLQFFDERLAGKDLQRKHLMMYANSNYLVLEKAFGVSLAEDKTVVIRFHPGGKFDNANDYYLDF